MVKVKCEFSESVRSSVDSKAWSLHLLLTSWDCWTPILISERVSELMLNDPCLHQDFCFKHYYVPTVDILVHNPQCLTHTLFLLRKVAPKFPWSTGFLEGRRQVAGTSADSTWDSCFWESGTSWGDPALRRQCHSSLASPLCAAKGQMSEEGHSSFLMERWAVRRQSPSRVPRFETPWTAPRQAPLSMGFSRQEHWSGLPCPSSTHESEVAQSCPTQRPHGLQPTRLLCPRDSPGKRTGVGCHCLLRAQG